MAVRSKRIIKTKIWIKPSYSAVYKLTVERGDGTIDDITNLITSFEVEDGVTETIGRFKFELYNQDGVYTNAWTGNEIFRYYSDYASTATTLRFRGRTEKISKHEMMVTVKGRSESLAFMEITVTQNYSATECSVILSDLISKYGSGFTSTNVTASTVDITVNWYQKPFWECVQELCTASGFDCYVDANLDFHFFAVGSVVNIGEAMVHSINLFNVGDFGEDLAQIRNRVIVYGANQEGVQIIYTAEDSSSQASYGIKEEIVNDGNITEYTQAQELGDYLLAQKKDPPIVGDIKGRLLATIQPGEKIRLSAPMDGINPGNYDIISYKHTASGEGLFTIVKVNKEPKKISHVLKDMIERQNKGQETSINPEEMRYSYNFLFDSDSGTHTTTEITNGVLKPTGASGNWISLARTTSTNIDKVYLVANGETLTGAIFEVSGDGGVNYQTVSNKSSITLTTAAGANLVVKVTFSNADTQLTSLSVQYKLT